MFSNIDNFIQTRMTMIPEGLEVIRSFRDDKKWISSNYRMSAPSKGNNQTESKETMSIETFYMSKFPVTNHLYGMVTGSQNYVEDKAHYPKVNISWLEAIEFCNQISLLFDLEPYYNLKFGVSNIECDSSSNGFRLATSAEWQYACKGTSGAYQYSEIDKIAWHLENSNNKLHEVGQKEANDWGLYDMLGNVWEWCWDLYNPDTYDHYRVFRGGSFAEKSRVCGATTRRKSLPEFAIDDLGFRLVKNV